MQNVGVVLQLVYITAGLHLELQLNRCKLCDLELVIRTETWLFNTRTPDCEVFLLVY